MSAMKRYTPSRNGDRRLKIMIVDDSLEHSLFVNDLLSPFGMCDMAINGEDALECIESALSLKYPYDLILLDVMMPGMDGRVVLQTIRAMEKKYDMTGADEAVIIMVSVLDSPDAVTESFFKGYCTDYLAKPITRNILLEKLVEYQLVIDF
ncbi:MAG: response regulator [Magnetococcales bacterium]|nr:response regulator [Magnetococcales bacterium]